MKILAIETSCDETAISIVKVLNQNPQKLQFKTIKNYIASQINIHRPWGGVVPHLAKREHIKNLPIIFSKIPVQEIKNINLLAVTTGPGLEPCLWTGINFLKEIKEKYFKKTKTIGVSHLNGHLYSFFLTKKYNEFIKNNNLNNLFPAIALIISGGHTILLFLNDLKKIKKLGETRDDAVGEAFDKVARLLNLPYPGGPEIEKLASSIKKSTINFPRPMLKDKNYDFSFSGLKTAVLYYLKNNPRSKKEEIAFSFQQAAFDVLLFKTFKAVQEFQTKSIFVSGGVIANKTLRQIFKKEAKKRNINILMPDFLYNTDNAAMIAVAGYIQKFILNKNYPLKANGILNYS